MVKKPSANVGEEGLLPGSGRSPGEGNGNPVQYFCLGSPMNRGAWRAIVHEFTKELGHDLATKQQQQQKTPLIVHLLYSRSCDERDKILALKKLPVSLGRMKLK